MLKLSVGSRIATYIYNILRGGFLIPIIELIIISITAVDRGKRLFLANLDTFTIGIPTSLQKNMITLPIHSN